MKIENSANTTGSIDLEKKKDMEIPDFSTLGVREALSRELKAVSSACINCKLCVRECAFLSAYGKPKEIADRYDPANPEDLKMSFECSLCGLCTAVCPAGADPSAMFLQMRAEAVERGKAPFPRHAGLIAYEQRGISSRYSYYALPKGCSRIFFPGCTLPGTRPKITLRLFETLRQWDPTMAIALDCCTKISHDLGRELFFMSAFEEMKMFLLHHGVCEVLVACPNCFKIFQRYGQDLKVRTVYEVLADFPFDRNNGAYGTVSVHDSCGVRFEEKVHAAVRKLVRDKGLETVEMQHKGTKTVCCGEGGSVGCLDAGLSRRWAEIREAEAEKRLLIAACAGCTGFLNATTSTVHVLDLVYDPKKAIQGKARVSRPPFTYLNRLKMKRYLKKNLDAVTTRERDLRIIKQVEGGGAGSGNRF